MRARLLVGVYRPDMLDERVNPSVVIAGCMDETTWEIVSPEESDAIFMKMKRAYDPGGGDYEWREVVAEFDESALRSLFQTTLVEARLSGAEARQHKDEG